MNVKLKRAYDPPSPDDGKRILVDRLWPRGLTKERARIDLWLRDVAPTAELRKWFAHDPKKWPEFQARYKEELKSQTPTLAQLKAEVAQGPLTLIFAARDVDHNEAVVLQNILRSK